ncbi:hypothetical protein PUN28_019041 [Cardiocondyla obscurior]|uniref:Uncharacterized protein n=1 Tax=Cardiocondyla obscurior TaxID=286306 RepID=A0AAW2EH40_9HYME
MSRHARIYLFRRQLGTWTYRARETDRWPRKYGKRRRKRELRALAHKKSRLRMRPAIFDVSNTVEVVVKFFNRLMQSVIITANRSRLIRDYAMHEIHEEYSMRGYVCDGRTICINRSFPSFRSQCGANERRDGFKDKYCSPTRRAVVVPGAMWKGGRGSVTREEKVQRRWRWKRECHNVSDYLLEIDFTCSARFCISVILIHFSVKQDQKRTILLDRAARTMQRCLLPLKENLSLVISLTRGTEENSMKRARWKVTAGFKSDGTSRFCNFFPSIVPRECAILKIRTRRFGPADGSPGMTL